MTASIRLVLFLVFIAFSGPTFAAACTVPGTYDNVSNAIADAGCNPITITGGVWVVSALISRDLTLQGAGSGNTVLIGKPNQAVIEILSPVAVHLEGIQLTAGPFSEPALVLKGRGSLTMTDVAITLSNQLFTIGGTVSGLVGVGLELQNNAGDDLMIGLNGDFTFPTALLDGSPYAVTVLAQPSNPSQTCDVLNDTGILAGTNVTNVIVSCTTKPDNIFTNGFEE